MNIKILSSVIEDLRALTSDRLDRTSCLSLVAGDADNIKGYLYDTPALPEIRGASVHLYKLNETGIRTVLRHHGLRPPQRFLLFSAGGGFTAVVPTKKAQAIAADIERLYLDRTGAATITTVIVNLVPADAVPQIPFGQIMAHVAHALRRKKLNKSRVPFYAVSPFVRQCTSCHLRPASHILDREGEKRLELCESCKLKRQAGIQKIRKGDQERSPYRNQIRKRLSDPDLVFPHTLKDIAEHSTRGYIAVVAADGNGVGNELFNLPRPGDYRSLSRGLVKATEETVFGVLADIGRAFQTRQMVPVEVIVTGGDDTLFVVPCQYGLRAAIDVCQAFANKTCELIGKTITMSAGVIIAPANYPMYFLEQMATALLSSAKRRAREENEGCIDFWFLRGHGMMGTDPLALRQQMLERFHDSHTHLQLHERPYTLERLNRLVELAKSFLDKDFPRSRLYGLRQALGQVAHMPRFSFFISLPGVARGSKIC